MPADLTVAERVARRELALARVDERVRVAVASAPPLPDDLRPRMREYIRAVAAQAAADAGTGRRAS